MPIRSSGPPEETFTIRSLDQLKVLADPLRVRIVEALCEERTTKQVAGVIGEPATKLYHHVEMLEKAGLVRQTRTRRNRGTLEKYYVAVARTFSADARIFSADAPASDRAAALLDVVGTMFRGTEEDLRRLLAESDAADAIESHSLLTYVEIRADPEQLAALRAQLQQLLESIGKLTDDDGESEGQERYRLTLAYFPLPGQKAR